MEPRPEFSSNGDMAGDAITKDRLEEVLYPIEPERGLPFSFSNLTLENFGLANHKRKLTEEEEWVKAKFLLIKNLESEIKTGDRKFFTPSEDLEINSPSDKTVFRDLLEEVYSGLNFILEREKEKVKVKENLEEVALLDADIKKIHKYLEGILDSLFNGDFLEASLAMYANHQHSIFNPEERVSKLEAKVASLHEQIKDLRNIFSAQISRYPEVEVFLSDCEKKLGEAEMDLRVKETLADAVAYRLDQIRTILSEEVK